MMIMALMIIIAIVTLVTFFFHSLNVFLYMPSIPEKISDAVFPTFRTHFKVFATFSFE